MGGAVFENKSFVLKAVKQVAIEDRPKPKLEDPHDVMVHVAHTGICGTDVHFWEEGRMGSFIVDSPMVLGHESSGVVVEVGSKVTNLKPGDKVAMEPGVPCRRCEICRNALGHLCPDMIFAGMPPSDGTLAKYYINASDFCYKLPDNMDLEQGAMVEPLSVACSVARTADLRAHQTVVVLGCGPIGILCQAVAKAWGASKVIGVDVVQARLDRAMTTFGVDGVFMPRRPGPGVDPMEHARAMAEEMKKTFGLGYGADVVLECSGSEPCVQMGVFVAKLGGTLVQAGMGKDNINFPITEICSQGLTLKGSIRYLAGCYPAAIELISSGKIDVKSLITNRFPFEQAEEAFELVNQRRPDVFKVMIAGVE